MTQTLQVWVGPAIIYLYGTVNGAAATFTLMGDGLWQAEVPRAEDDRYEIHLEAYSASGLEAVYDYTLYYGFVAAKTDWGPDDYETDDDWARQRSNVLHIVETVLPELYYFPIAVAIPVQGMEGIPFADILKAMEDALAAVEGCGVTLPADWESGKTWAAGGAAPDYTDINRWERNPLLIYEMAQRIHASDRYCGTFYAGQNMLLPSGGAL